MIARFMCVALLVLLFAGCAGKSGQPVRSPAAPAASPTAYAPEPSPTTGLQANQRKIGNLLLTVNGAAPYTDELFPAEPGTHYVALDVTAVNTGTKTYSLN